MAIHELFPYLHVKSTPQAIAFYTKVFGAREMFRLAEPNGRVGHAELDFNGTTLMLSDEFPEYGIRGAARYRRNLGHDPSPRRRCRRSHPACC